MNLEYQEFDETILRLRYCLTYKSNQFLDEEQFLQNVNNWSINQFGNIGEFWGWQRILDKHINYFEYSYGSRLFSPFSKITYIWLFKNKEDAMIFKLKWGGLLQNDI